MRFWLREMREKSGFTMSSIACKLGISESYYCAIESGDRQKKMDIMLASSLAAIFGVPVSLIVEKETAVSNAADAQAVIST